MNKKRKNSKVARDAESTATLRKDNDVEMAHRKCEPETTHVVLWSGGADSTKLLTDTIKQHGKCLALTVTHHQFGDTHLMSEHFAKLKLEHVIQRTVGQFTSHTINVTSTMSVAFNSGGLPIPTVWLATVLPYIPVNSVLQIGYVVGDCFWDFEQQFRTAFDAINKMLSRQCTLEFPLGSVHKDDILRQLLEMDLLQHVVYCEHNESQPCLKCASCRRHYDSLTWLRDTRYDGPHRKHLKQIIRELRDRRAAINDRTQIGACVAHK